MTYQWIMREEAAGNIYQEVDGFWVWGPGKLNGSLNEGGLLFMADYLKAKNALWEWIINHDPAISGNAEKAPNDL